MKPFIKMLTIIFAALGIFLFSPSIAFADTNDNNINIKIPKEITSIQATNGKITLNFNESVTGLTAKDFDVITLLQNEPCGLPDLTFNPEDNSFNFTSLYNKSPETHTLTIIISASKDSTNIISGAVAQIYLKPHGASITLTWGARPRDLDSYLVLPNKEAVYYGKDQVLNPDGTIKAYLNDDYTNGYGPETIIINSVTDGKYYFLVHNSSAGINIFDSSLSRYGAEVTVSFNDNTTVFTTPSRDYGTFWSVFKIVNKEIVPINNITITPPIMDIIGL